LFPAFSLVLPFYSIPEPGRQKAAPPLSDMGMPLREPLRRINKIGNAAISIGFSVAKVNFVPDGTNGEQSGH